MSSAKKIAKNTGFLFAAEIADKLLSFFLVVVITRYLGDVGFGVYSFAFAFVGIFSILSNLGLATFMIREIAKDKSRTEKFVNNIVTLKFLLDIPLFALVILTAIMWERFSSIVPIIGLVVIHELINSVILMVKAMFNAHEKMGYILLTTSIERIFSFLLSFFILYLGYGIQVLIIALIISKLITLTTCYIVSKRKFITIKPSLDLKFLWYSIKNSLPFWFTLLFYRVYTSTDTIMLSAMKDFAVTGWYSAASKITAALSFLPNVIIDSVFPAMSRFHETSKESLNKLFEKTFYYLFTIAFPLALGISLLANRFIYFIYKEQFIKSGVILQILIWSVLFFFINQSLGHLLNAINKQKYFTISNGVCAIVNVMLNFILIPKFSYIGAATATVVALAVNFSLLYYFTSKNGYRLNIIKIIYRPIVAGIVMGITIIYLDFLHILVIVPAAMILYFGVLFLIGGIGKEEINLVKSFLPKTQKNN